MYKPELRQRLDALFADIERLATNPAGNTYSVRLELDELRTRLHDLEAEIAIFERVVAPPEPARPSIVEPAFAEEEGIPRREVPLLYEKEWIGYAFSGDEVQPLGSPLETESAAVVPLTARGQAIGNVQLQPPPERAWTPEETELLNAVAQQASFQIQNLRLLDATERARFEAEAATRRFMHENWDSFLDGVNQAEQIGYAYDQSSVKPFLSPLRMDGGIQQVVKVMEEHVGTLYLQPDPSRPLMEEDRFMVAAIADQVAQQVENIRLLADASRARAEAEEATRRLTREGWQAYTSLQHENDLGFVYDANRVKPLNTSDLPREITLVQPLTIRGETIGQLAVANLDDIPPEAAGLASAIAERASVHLETLRLSNEIQKRAAELQTVAHVSTTVSTVLDPDELLQSVVDLTKERFGLYHAHIYLADESWNTLLLAAGAGEAGRKMVADGWHIDSNHPSSIVATAARNRKPIIANDVYHDKDSSFLSNRLLPDTRSEIAVPMIIGEKLLGVFDVQSDVVGRFSEQDANIYTTLAAQVGVALQNARLYVEQAATVAQLRELDRLKSSFLANMSHELRTPLNSILGFSDVMLEGLDGQLTEYMDNDLRLIQKNGQHLLHLINDVLDMAKIESGRMNLNPEQFKIHDVLEEVTSITSTLASEKNLSLSIAENSDQEAGIYADNTRLRQVMINLVNNSIKFTEKGRIVLSAKVIEGSRILVTVEDTGIGIPPDKLEAIFQEFTQVDSSTTRKAGGTGLGLPISRRLVEMHGGRLWAESTGIPGEGSIFFVELPVEARITEVAEKLEK
jgi:signal transduction histidine kinase